MSDKYNWTQFYNEQKKDGLSDQQILAHWQRYVSTGTLPSGMSKTPPGALKTLPNPLTFGLPQNSFGGQGPQAPTNFAASTIHPGRDQSAPVAATPMRTLPNPLSFGLNRSPSALPSFAALPRITSSAAPTSSNLGTAASGPFAAQTGTFNNPMRAQNRSEAPYSPSMASTVHPGRDQPAPVPGPSSPTDLDALIAALGQTPSYAPINYNDFSAQGNEIAAQQFSGQNAALDNQSAAYQTQYGKSDPIIKGLYDQLQASIRASAGKTAEQYAQAGTARQTQGDALSNQIGQNYQGAASSQADILSRLGIQAAAPSTLGGLTSDQAWQQSQAAQATQGQRDYLSSAGQGAVDFQNNTANAEGTAGTVARQDLLSQLQAALQNVSSQKTSLAGQQSSAASDIIFQLMNNARQNQAGQQSAQQDALGNMLQAYNLNTQADNTAYSRSQDTVGNAISGQNSNSEAINAQIAQDTFNAKYGTAAVDQTGTVNDPNFGNFGALDQLSIQLGTAYGQPGIDALKIAVQIAGNLTNSDVGGTGSGTDVATFVNQVMQQTGGANSAAVVAAATAVAKMMNLKASGSL